MEISGAAQASGITMNANVRAQALKLIEVEKIPIAAISREAFDEYGRTAEFIEWLGGGRKAPEFVAKIGEFITSRLTIRTILSQVSNELRGEAGSKLMATLGRIVIGMRDAADEAEREELFDHAALYLLDLRWLFEIMAQDQTIRSALKPGASWS
jgi:hypothetical protein